MSWNFISRAIGVLVVSAGIAWAIWYQPGANNILTVAFLDVGQGDAIMITAPNGRTVLIDGGRPDGGIVEQLSAVMPWHERTIDLVILTHPDDDHGGGLVEVARRYRVARVLHTGVVHDTPSYLALLAEIKRQEVPVTVIDRPQRIVLDADVYLEIVYPHASVAGRATSAPNETSIVARLVYDEISFLFTGDLGEKGEAALLAGDTVLQSDVLKVGHHGSDSSTTQKFIMAVAPQHAIVQVGEDNNYGHPSLRVLRRLERAGSAVWRTDTQGRIEVRTDGKRLEIQQSRRPFFR